MNKDLSDYNYLKNQQDPVKKFNKYKRQLSKKPNEKQKYYAYLTYEQPILDELNYNEMMQQKDKQLNEVKKDTKIFAEDKAIIEDIKKEANNEIVNSLNDDLFAGNNTLKEVEVNQPILYEKPSEYDKIKNELISKGGVQLKDKAISEYDKIKNELISKGSVLLEKLPKEKYQEALKKYPLLTSISDTLNRPIIKNEQIPVRTKKEINKELFTNITKDMPISNDLQVPTKPKRGRPKGSTTNYKAIEFNRESKKLDISGETPIIINKKEEAQKKKEQKNEEKQLKKLEERRKKRAYSK